MSRMRKFLVAISILFISSMPMVSEAQNFCTCTGSGFGYLYGGDVSDLKIERNGTTLFYTTKIGSNTVNKVFTPSTPVTLALGDTFWISVNSYSDTQSAQWFTRVAVWIDFDHDGDFAATECVIDPTNTLFKNFPYRTWLKLPVGIPYSAKLGQTRIRLRGCEQFHTMTLNDGCTQNLCYGNQVDVTIGIESVNGTTPISAEKKLHIFPNPATQTIQITLPPGLTQITTVSVLDLQGRVVKKITLDPKASELIYISDLPNGLYTLNAVSSEFSGTALVSVTR